jgi:thymidylate synthase (FAD)
LEVRLETITNNAEAFIARIARVSNPANQDNPDYVKLIKFLIRNKHYSPFEHASMTVEIKTSRAIAAQILRHRSFTFQEFSQRYSEVTEFEPIELRKQATKNRQSSLEVFDPELIGMGKASDVINVFISRANVLYKQLVASGVAKETARMILPLNTQTTLYMTGTIRSFIHYIELRTKEDVQKEHRDIALQIEGIFNGNLPVIATALAQLRNEQRDKDFLYSLLTSGYIKIEGEHVTLQEGYYKR